MSLYIYLYMFSLNVNLLYNKESNSNSQICKTAEIYKFLDMYLMLNVSKSVHLDFETINNYNF